MPVSKITGQGLLAIAFSVALLWGCWIQERAVMRRVYAERARVLHDLKVLRRTQQPEPVSAPRRRARRAPRVTAG